jgi:hypothetical protein
MKYFLILLFIGFAGCTAVKALRVKYPDCNSFDIEYMDSCLLNKPLSFAISKLGIDSSQFFLFDEPPGVMRGIYVFALDTVQIRIYTDRVQILDSLGFVNYDTTKYMLNDKKVVGVSWRKKEKKKERIIGHYITYWGF